MDLTKIRSTVFEANFSEETKEKLIAALQKVEATGSWTEAEKNEVMALLDAEIESANEQTTALTELSGLFDESLAEMQKIDGKMTDKLNRIEDKMIEELDEEEDKQTGYQPAT